MLITKTSSQKDNELPRSRADEESIKIFHFIRYKNQCIELIYPDTLNYRDSFNL